MDLKFNNQIYSYDYTPTMNEVIDRTKELLGENYYFQHFILNGTETIVAAEELCNKIIEDQTVIEIVAIESKEFVKDLVQSGVGYVKNAKPEIGKLAEQFYSHPTPNSWATLSDLFEGIEWILAMIEGVNKSEYKPLEWEEVLQQSSDFKNELGNLEEAMGNTDAVLIADILKYELLPLFEVIELKATNFIIKSATGETHDAN